MSKPTVAILGASADRRKFGNKSVRAHIRAGYAVFPINPKADEIEGLTVYRTLGEVPCARLHRVSVYLPPDVGMTVLDEIRASQPAEVWFNPGSESPILLQRARELDIPVVAGCSIVDVGMSPDDFPDA